MTGKVELYRLVPGAPESGTAYGCFDEPVEVEGLADHLPRGEILGLRPQAGAGWAEIRPVIARAVRRVVNGTFALVTDLADQHRAAELAFEAGDLGIHMVVRETCPERDRVRASLTDPSGWPWRVARWVATRRGGRLSPDARFLVESVTEAAQCYPGMAVAPGWSASRAQHCRRTFALEGLGRPVAWFGALRTVVLAMALQREPATSLAVLAHRHGYSGAGKLSDRISDGIGASHGYIRTRLGWTWLLVDALRRRNILENVQK